MSFIVTKCLLQLGVFAGAIVDVFGGLVLTMRCLCCEEVLNEKSRV